MGSALASIPRNTSTATTTRTRRQPVPNGRITITSAESLKIVPIAGRYGGGFQTRTVARPRGKPVTVRPMDPGTLDHRAYFVYQDSAIPGASNSDTPPSRELEIELLYIKLRRLARRAESDPTAEVEYQRTMETLQELQREESRRLQALMDAHLELQPGQGYAALKRAEEVLARYADPAPENPPTETSDS